MGRKSNLQKNFQAKIREVREKGRELNASLKIKNAPSENISLLSTLPEDSIIRSYAAKIEIKSVHQRNEGQIGQLNTGKTIFEESISPELDCLIKKYEIIINNKDKNKSNLIIQPNQLDLKIKEIELADPNNKMIEMADLVTLDLLYQQAKLLHQHNNLVKQIKILYPANPAIFFLEGLAAFWNNRNINAEPLLQKAVEGGFHHALLYNTLGTLLMQKSNVVQAEKYFQKAIMLDPTYETAYYNLCALYAFRGELNKSEQYLMQSMALNPIYEKPYYALLQMLIGQKYTHIKQGLTKIAIFLHPSGMGERNVSPYINITRNQLSLLYNLRISNRNQILTKLLNVWAPFRNLANDPSRLMAKKDEILGLLDNFGSSLIS